MGNLFLKEERLEASPPIVGYKIMKFVEETADQRISLFDIAENFSKEKWFSTKNLYFGLMFLFSINLIEFKPPYVIKNVQN